MVMFESRAGVGGQSCRDKTVKASMVGRIGQDWR